MRHLRARGLKPIATNFCCRFGEVDLVMQDGDCLVFAEVRYRTSSLFAHSSETVDRRKQAKIIRTAASFIAGNPRFQDFPVRFDIVALDGTGDGRVRLQWIRDAFRDW